MDKLITLRWQTNSFNLLLAAVRMRFGQNGGQTNNLRKDQKVDKLITIRHIYIYAVELVSGPRFGHFKVNNWATFVFYKKIVFQKTL